MAYFLDLFSPETHAKFSTSARNISGFRIRQKKSAERVKIGDRLVCYLTRLSRWVGVLEVKGAAFEDSKKIFVSDTEIDPFVVRFQVQPLVWLPFEQGVPIHDDAVWKKLSFTSEHPHDSVTWTGHVRSSLSRLKDADGKFLEEVLLRQRKSPRIYSLDEQDHRKLTGHVVKRLEGEVSVTVPDDAPVTFEQQQGNPDSRESIKVQALVARIGAAMGFKIWLPANDRAAICKEWDGAQAALVRELPLNYDKTTIDTIERIDVLWLRGRSIVRAFEVEHTTAIYSGILRMADLLSLQPNMAIKLHIVAPLERRQKVFDEIRRPVFALLERGPLSASCSFLSYDSVREVANLKHLAHLSESVLDEYEEEAEET